MIGENPAGIRILSILNKLGRFTPLVQHTQISGSLASRCTLPCRDLYPLHVDSGLYLVFPQGYVGRAVR